MKYIYVFLIFTSCSLLEEEVVEQFCIDPFNPNEEGYFDIECPDNYSICYGEDCYVNLYTDFEKDENGYYNIPVNHNGRFNIHIETPSLKPYCQYNGVTVIKSKFDSNTYYEIESGLSFTLPLYNPFQSLYTQGGNPIKLRDTIVTLDYFQGTIQGIVQETSIYHDVKDKMECYGWDEPFSGPTPLVTGDCKMYSKRIVGPIPNLFKGDTIKIYSQTYFDCGNFSEQKRDSLSVIII